MARSRGHGAASTESDVARGPALRPGLTGLLVPVAWLDWPTRAECRGLGRGMPSSHSPP
jgi:hypothetical protein